MFRQRKPCLARDPATRVPPVGANGLPGRRRASLLVACALLGLSASDSTARLNAGAYLTNGVRGEETITTVGQDLEKVSVFAYHITEDGAVRPPSPWVPEVLARLMANPGSRLILITVNNRVLGPDGKLTPEHGGDTVKAILSDPQKRAGHIRQLAALARKAHGIELNYERFTADMRDPFTAFLRDLRAAMPPGKKLSLVVQPKEDRRSGSNGRAVDWRAVEPYVDYVRIMAYYYSWSTSAHGPALPMETLRRLADFALNDPEQGIPRHKVSIILSLWGWDWPMPVGTPGTLVQYQQAMDTARTRGAIPLRHPAEHTLNFHYVASDGRPHEVWIDDFASIRARIKLLQDMGMPRIDLWHLNTGDPALWNFLAAETAMTRHAGIDFDGDHLSDFAVFRPRNASWYIDLTHTGGTNLSITYGKNGDIPVPADYDGDGVLDIAVFRPSYAGWFVDTNLNGGTDLRAVFGQRGDIPVPADYNGDGKTDFAVFRPGSGSWFIDTTHTGGSNLSVVFGQPGDIPMPGDYDGDGKADLAVFRPASGTWFVDTGHDGGTDISIPYGQSGDLPLATDYDGDGRTDFAVFRPAWPAWHVDTDRNGGTDISTSFGQGGDIPVPGNHDGDGVMDFAVFRPGTARWRVDTNHRGDAELDVVYGAAGDIPLRENGWILDAMGLTPR